MSRWTYPITLESNMLPGQSFEHGRRHVYREQNVKLSRSAVVEELVVLGENTIVGDDSRIEGSVLGRGCVIQANSVVCGSHLFQGVRVASNCHIRNSVLAEGVVVLEGTTLESGCVVGRHAVVGPHVVIPALTKITADREWSVDARRDASGGGEGGGEGGANGGSGISPDDLVERLRRNRELLGVDAQAYPYESSHSEEEEEPDLLNSRLGRMGLVPPCGLAADHAADVEGDTDANAAFTETEDEGDWEREVEESLHRAFLESHSIDIAALELNTLKMAMNISFADLRSVVIPILLARADPAMAPKDIRLLLARWGPLIGKFVHHLDDQVDTIIIISVGGRGACVLVSLCPCVRSIIRRATMTSTHPPSHPTPPPHPPRRKSAWPSRPCSSTSLTSSSTCTTWTWWRRRRCSSGTPASRTPRSRPCPGCGRPLPPSCGG
jgi:translation initiation factor eIF-2B subunit epsilon